jgi:tRNA A-37 threonylcarbamoyl transferase component Bud32
MFKKIHLPPSYTFIQRGKVFLVIKEEYKDLLLQQGIEEIEIFLQAHQNTAKYLHGRILHPSIPLRDGERVVFRQYSHGGLLGTLTRSLYLFGARSLQELALTEKILSSGIPTVQPIGAIHRPVFLLIYKAYLLSLEIPDAKDLIQYFREMGRHPSRERLLHKRKTIRSAGRLLRQFHQAGFFHRDLQLKNILVAGEQVFLIDFDHSYQREILTTREMRKNLFRLNRSVEKWRGLGILITRTDRFRFFEAYARKDEEIWKVMRKALRTYSTRYFLYQWRWRLQRLLGVQGLRSLG